MLASAVVVSTVGLVLGFLTLIGLGHRIRKASLVASMLYSIAASGVSGEIAARVFQLPSVEVIASEIALAGVALGVAMARRAWNPVGVWFFAAVIMASVTFLALAAQSIFADGLNVFAMALSGGMWILELAAFLLAATFSFETCDVICRTEWHREVTPLPSGYRPFVSLHVPAYNEPPEMLMETIASLEALDYSDFEIVVIDNNTKDPEVWQPVHDYCASRDRVRFVHVDPWPGFKSGALNLALRQHTDPRAEIVGIVDADYLVKPEWLGDLVGLFADAEVAFVQTPQDYREWQGDSYLTACHDAFSYFFVSTMRSRNERNSIIFGGTMGLLRRSLLDQLGGWDEWCITEDAEMSLRILARGYQGLYIAKSYGEGIMPLTFDALKRQRFRWCFGSMQIMRKHWRTLLLGARGNDNRLGLTQRIDYTIGIFQWFTDLVALGFTATLFASTITVLAGHPLNFLPFGGAIIALPISLALIGALRATWALRKLNNVSLKRAAMAFANWLALSWTVAMACAKAMVKRDGVFLRTPKWRGSGGLGEALRSTRAESSLAILLWVSGIAMVYERASAGLVFGAFALWQGTLYASAPAMAWLNLHTELSARLERRQRTEERRERIVVYGTHATRTSVLALLLGAAAVLTFGEQTATEKPGVGSFHLPHRTATDHGPLGNIGVLSGVQPSGGTTTTSPGGITTTAVATPRKNLGLATTSSSAPNATTTTSAANLPTTTGSTTTSGVVTSTDTTTTVRTTTTTGVATGTSSPASTRVPSSTGAPSSTAAPSPRP